MANLVVYSALEQVAAHLCGELRNGTWSGVMPGGDKLAAHDIEPGSYHLPDWEETIDDLHARMENLFRVTPPTALILDEAPFFVAAQHFLARRGLSVPEDVSLVCNDADPAFDWCKPPVSHIRWDSTPVVRRVLKWASNLSRGMTDLRQTLTPSDSVRDGTVGPVRD